MERSDRDVDQFLDGISESARHDMQALDEAIANVMEGHPRELYVGTFWGGSDQQIIGYGRTTSTRSDGGTIEYFLIGLALQKNYISVYISAVEGHQYLSEKYGEDIASEGGKVKVGKSSISFKSTDDIDVDKLISLAERARGTVEV